MKNSDSIEDSAREVRMSIPLVNSFFEVVRSEAYAPYILSSFLIEAVLPTLLCFDRLTSPPS